MRKLNDHWSQKAKKEGYPARSVYKLQEINDKFNIFTLIQKEKRGQSLSSFPDPRVPEGAGPNPPAPSPPPSLASSKTAPLSRPRILDLGASPGSWTLWLLKNLKPCPSVVAVDLAPLAIPPHPNLTFVQGDITDPAIGERLRDLGPFHALLSDAAPATTGVRTVDTARSEGLVEGALTLVPALLLPGGSCVIKLFQGSEIQRIRARMEELFSFVKSFKPKACRSESFELYLIGMDKK